MTYFHFLDGDLVAEHAVTSVLTLTFAHAQRTRRHLARVTEQDGRLPRVLRAEKTTPGRTQTVLFLTVWPNLWAQKITCV